MRPWRFKLQMAATQDGHVLEAPYGVCELFEDDSAWEKYAVQSATTINRVMRGALARVVKRRRERPAREIVELILNDSAAELWRRDTHAVRLQATAKGFLLRNTDWRTDQFRKHFAKGARKEWALKMVQAKCKSRLLERKLMKDLETLYIREAASRIQKRWRGILGRRLVGQIIEHSTWPLKGIFNYTATGKDSCSVQVLKFNIMIFDINESFNILYKCNVFKIYNFRQ